MAAAEPVLVEVEHVRRVLAALGHAQRIEEISSYGVQFDLAGNKYVRLTDIIKQVQFLRDERARLRGEDDGVAAFDAVLLLLGGMLLT